MATVFAEVQEVLASHFEIDKSLIVPEAHFEDLDGDSLAFLEAVIQLEKVFSKSSGRKIEIRDRVLDDVETVQDLLDRLAAVGLHD